MRVVNPYFYKCLDGSYTVDTGLKESYHSRQGAVSESLYVYIECGLKYVLKRSSRSSVRILEVGLGTGLNLLLSYLLLRRYSIEVQYDALEPYPINQEMLSFLIEKTKEVYKRPYLKLMENNEKNEVKFEFMTVKKINEKIGDFLFKNGYDLIYFDPFAPSYQPEIWSSHMAKKLYHLMNIGGVMTSYSVQGKFLRFLRGAGLYPSKLKGTLGKRHCLRVFKWPIKGEKN